MQTFSNSKRVKNLLIVPLEAHSFFFLLFHFIIIVNPFITDVNQRRRRRCQGRRQVKNEFIFYQRNSQLSRSVQYANGSKNVLRLNMKWQRSIPNRNNRIYKWFATILERFKWQRPWRPCWMTGTMKLIRILLLIVMQHGGDDVSCKRSISRRRSRSSDDAELGHFTFLFCRGWQRTVQRFRTHAHSQSSAH